MKRLNNRILESIKVLRAYNVATDKLQYPALKERKTVDIADATIEQLQEEIDRKKRENIKPTVPNEVDFRPLVKQCKEYIDWVASDSFDENEDDDWEHYIYETALECCFGKNVWDFIVARQE